MSTLETPVKIDFQDIPAMEPKIGIYTQYCITANNFIIATFVDPISRASYSDYLKKYGMNKFPDEIKKIIAYQGHDVLKLGKEKK